MLFTEWNLKDALEVAREEGMEKALALMEKGYSSAEIKKLFYSNQTHRKRNLAGEHP